MKLAKRKGLILNDTLWEEFMPRPGRGFVSQGHGSYHIISRVVGKQWLLKNAEKEYFLSLLMRLAEVFYIRIHSFCIMSNHFHLLVSCLDRDAQQASKEELLERYKLLYPKQPGPPEGSYGNNGELINPDDDGGIERLRKRLGTLPYFVKELKQSFTNWYNAKHDREGYFWGQRYKSTIVSLDEAQLACSAYIDLNPVRAGIVKSPEDYRWSSLGLRVRSKSKADAFLYPLSLIPSDDLGAYQAGANRFEPLWLSPVIQSKKVEDNFSLYREFVYKSGAIEREGKASISPELVNAVVSYHGHLGISDRFRYRVKNISEGLAFGSYELIESLQKQLKRKYIRPRSFMNRDKNCNWSFSTRILRS